MNRLFTRVMWAVAVVLVCAVCVALAAPTTKSRTSSPAGIHPASPAVAAAAGSAR